MIVGDGTPASPTTRSRSSSCSGMANVIAGQSHGYHRSTFNDQHAHAHPRFSPDGKHILYTSDLTGYSNLYLVEIGDFDDLPDLTADMRG